MADDSAPDVGRTAVYAAELAAFDGTDLEEPIGVDTVVGLVAQVTAGEWWCGPHVEVCAARSGAGSSSTRCVAIGTAWPTEVTIRIAAPQATVATAAHELAHALAGQRAGHGPEFRRAYLDVVAVITNLSSTERRGDLHVHQLADAFRAAELPIGRRTWAAPPQADIGPIAL